ncbi:response regulator, partial [Escherichia coli]|nr:response regulator [Escherichia coli]
MKPTSVIIMDTHPIIRMSIEVLLQKNSELQIVLKTDDYRITIDYLRTRPVDLIIMDIDLGNDSNLLIVFYVQIMPDDFVMQLHR